MPNSQHNERPRESEKAKKEENKCKRLEGIGKEGERARHRVRGSESEARKARRARKAEGMTCNGADCQGEEAQTADA